MKVNIEMAFCGMKMNIKKAYFLSPDICLLSPLLTPILFLHLGILETLSGF